MDYLEEYYPGYNEDGRLLSRHGQVEYLTTMKYIRECISGAERPHILEVGAGTGRYSIALAGEGMDVTAVELVESNLAILRENSRGMKNIASFRGDATDLSRFGDGTFDMTLVLGPLYHLYEQEEIHRAIDEAIRVTKPGGVIMLATGTWTSLKCSSLTMAERMPMVLWRSPMVKPGVFFSTTKVAMLLGPASWSVRA